MNNVNALLTPGMLVRNVQQPDWGVGQVQSNISGRITVNFVETGKIVLSNDVELEIVFSQ